MINYYREQNWKGINTLINKGFELANSKDVAFSFDENLSDKYYFSSDKQEMVNHMDEIIHSTERHTYSYIFSFSNFEYSSTNKVFKEKLSMFKSRKFTCKVNTKRFIHIHLVNSKIEISFEQNSILEKLEDIKSEEEWEYNIHWNRFTPYERKNLEIAKLILKQEDIKTTKKVTISISKFVSNGFFKKIKKWISK